MSAEAKGETRRRITREVPKHHTGQPAVGVRQEQHATLHTQDRARVRTRVADRSELCEIHPPQGLLSLESAQLERWPGTERVR
jgi:hypothetical protein